MNTTPLRNRLNLAAAVGALAVALALLLVGCAPQPPEREPDMSLAKVESATQAGDEWTLNVVVPKGAHDQPAGLKPDDYAGPMAATVLVTADTGMTKFDGSFLKRIDIQEVIDASSMSIWFVEAAQGAEPVEVTASYILLTP